MCTLCVNYFGFSFLEAVVAKHNHPAKCAVCGFKAYKRCKICGVSLHNNKARGEAAGKNCFLNSWLNKYCFGLCYNDQTLVGKSAAKWSEPTQGQKTANKRLINLFSNNH